MSSDGSLLKACTLDDLEEGEIFLAEVPGAGRLALYKIGDDVFATDDTCTHGQASLSEDGFVEAFIVTCSWHDGAFDVRTGQPVALPCTIPLRTYKVTVEGDEVFVSV